MTPSLSGVQYKGFTVNGLLAYVSERFGEETVQAAVQSLPPELRDAADSRTSLAEDWVPVECYFGIVQFVVEQHLRGDLQEAQRIGYEVTLRDIQSIFKMVLRFTSPSMVLGMARRMWRSYCNQGELIYTDEEGVKLVTLRDFSYQAPLCMHELAGGFRAYLECSSAKDPRVEVLGPGADGALRWRLYFE